MAIIVYIYIYIERERDKERERERQRERILHGKCWRTAFTHELLKKKTTSA